jgi:hypothetical protein
MDIAKAAPRPLEAPVMRIWRDISSRMGWEDDTRTPCLCYEDIDE